VDYIIIPVYLTVGCEALRAAFCGTTSFRNSLYTFSNFSELGSGLPLWGFPEFTSLFILEFLREAAF